MAAAIEKSQLVSFTLPTPTMGYSADYMNSLVRSLEIFFEREQEEGNIRGSTLILTQLPTSGANLLMAKFMLTKQGF